jgi:uncharacterized membrane protein YdjX (TVP38/TMEM64 family)
MSKTKTKPDRRTIVLRILTLLVFGGIAVLSVYMYIRYGKEVWEFVKDTDRFKEWVRGFGPWSVLILLAIRTAQTVCKLIPAEPIEIASGLLYGAVGGLVLCLLGNILGTIIIIFMTRKLGNRILELFHLENKLRTMAFLQDREKRNMLLFVFYLILGTPKDGMTYFVAMTDINMTEFVIMTAFARIPSILSSTICGALLGEKNMPLAIGVFAATAAVSLAGGFAYKKISAKYIKKKQADEEETEHNEEQEQ